MHVWCSQSKLLQQCINVLQDGFNLFRGKTRFNRMDEFVAHTALHRFMHHRWWLPLTAPLRLKATANYGETKNWIPNTVIQSDVLQK